MMNGKMKNLLLPYMMLAGGITIWALNHKNACKKYKKLIK